MPPVLPGSPLSRPYTEAGSFPGSGQLGLKPNRLLEQLEHAPNARKVEPGGREFDDLAEPVDVPRAVIPGAARASLRIQESLPLVGAKRLGMKAAQLGGHRDAEHPAVGLNRSRLHRIVQRSST